MKASKSKTDPVPNGAKAPVVITSMEQLSALCATPLSCRFKLDQQEVVILCRRLSPKEEEALLAKEREARPQRIPGKTAEEDRFDTSSASYLEKRERCAKTARAMAVYMGCPAVASGNPGLVDAAAIYEYVQGLFTEWVLELLHATIRGGGIEAVEREVSERANFTTAPESAES